MLRAQPFPSLPLKGERVSTHRSHEEVADKADFEFGGVHSQLLAFSGLLSAKAPCPQDGAYYLKAYAFSRTRLGAYKLRTLTKYTSKTR